MALTIAGQFCIDALRRSVDHERRNGLDPILSGDRGAASGLRVGVAIRVLAERVVGTRACVAQHSGVAMRDTESVFPPRHLAFAVLGVSESVLQIVHFLYGLVAGEITLQDPISGNGHPQARSAQRTLESH